MLARSVAVAATALCIAIAQLPIAHAEEPSAAEQQYIQALRSLKWVHGPQKVTVNSNAALNVPDGYLFLNPADTKRFMELQQNPSAGNEYLLAPDDLRWFAVLEYEATGYVKDDEKIDAPAILDSIRQGTEHSNKERRAKGWGEIHIVGWKYVPRYDPETKQLEWAIDGRDEKNNSVINFNTRILGRHGVTSAVLVANPAILNDAVSEFKSTLKDFKYLPGETYAEFKQGDKVAEYGLAALVAGGAAAALVKTGAAKGLWKLIGAGVVAALAGLKALFSRNKA